jgi:3-carboxy-cis,cis-muconate cycloisomerase
MSSPYNQIFYAEQVSALFSTESLLRTMLRAEAELAKAQAKHGLIPATSATTIEKASVSGKINTNAIIQEAGKGGNLVIPLVNQLMAVVDQDSKDDSRYVHFGATSQDIIDTAMMIQLQDTTKFLS